MYEKALTKTVALFIRFSEPTTVKGWYEKRMSNITYEPRAEIFSKLLRLLTVIGAAYDGTCKLWVVAKYVFVLYLQGEGFF
jgi:hypothetical protein